MEDNEQFQKEVEALAAELHDKVLNSEESILVLCKYVAKSLLLADYANRQANVDPFVSKPAQLPVSSASGCVAAVEAQTSRDSINLQTPGGKINYCYAAITKERHGNKLTPWENNFIVDLHRRNYPTLSAKQVNRINQIFKDLYESIGLISGFENCAIGRRGDEDESDEDRQEYNQQSYGVGKATGSFPTRIPSADFDDDIPF